MSILLQEKYYQDEILYYPNPTRQPNRSAKLNGAIQLLDGEDLTITKQALENSGIGLSRGEKFSVLLIYSAIGIATLIGFAASLVVGALSARLAALGILAYTFGLRHGVDADHIRSEERRVGKGC